MTWWEQEFEDIDWGLIGGIAAVAVCGAIIGGALVLMVS